MGIYYRGSGQPYKELAGGVQGVWVPVRATMDICTGSRGTGYREYKHWIEGLCKVCTGALYRHLLRCLGFYAGYKLRNPE